MKKVDEISAFYRNFKNMIFKKSLAVLLIILSTAFAKAQTSFDKDIASVKDKVIEWRRDFHQNPELGNREFKTAEKIAKHLKSLGIEVQTGVAKTGVVGVLKGNKPGKVVALRADIDALPVTERNDLPFKSEVTTTFLGADTGVMHACGHDTHTAILMGVAEVLSKNKDKIKEVDAIFGLHINSGTPVNTIRYKSGGTMAAVERFVVNVKGKQSHGSQPWSGIDPILISAKIVDGFQSIISRESKLTDEAAVITVGKITSGLRFNIIPESAEMIGTVRTLDPDMREKIIRRMTEMASDIAKAYGGEATIDWQEMTLVTYNDPALTAQMLPTLNKVGGAENIQTQKAARLYH